MFHPLCSCFPATQIFYSNFHSVYHPQFFVNPLSVPRILLLFRCSRARSPFRAMRSRSTAISSAATFGHSQASTGARPRLCRASAV